MNALKLQHLQKRDFPGTNKKIAFAAGKSGGHIVPCLTIAISEKNKGPCKTIFFTTNQQLDTTIIQSNRVAVDIHKPLALKMLPQSFIHYPQFIWHFFCDLWSAFTTLYTHSPAYIISTGSIVALPVCIAGYLLHIPIHLYELNAVPGNAIVKLATLADTVHCCFTGLEKYIPAKKIKSTAYPIRYNREELAQTSVDARKTLNLAPEKITITILGGSQGSQFINEIVETMVSTPLLDWQNIQFIHQTGHNQVDQVRTIYKTKKISAYVFDYNPHLSTMYAAADIIIARAGAGTIFETAAFEKPCILIPLETAVTDHQLDNARTITQTDPAHFYTVRQEAIVQNPLLLADSIKKMLQTCKKSNEITHIKMPERSN